MNIKINKVESEVIKPYAKWWAKIIIYGSFILIIPIFWYIKRRNFFIKINHRLTDTISGINAQLKKRFDLLSKLINTIENHIKLEKNTLKNFKHLKIVNNLDVHKMNELNLKMDQMTYEIDVQLKRYPHLQSTQTIVNLQLEARDCAEDIATSRRFYNNSVSDYNQLILNFPNNVIAQRMHLKTHIFFEASKINRQDVEMNFY